MDTATLENFLKNPDVRHHVYDDLISRLENNLKESSTYTETKFLVERIYKNPQQYAIDSEKFKEIEKLMEKCDTKLRAEDLNHLRADLGKFIFLLRSNELFLSMKHTDIEINFKSHAHHIESIYFFNKNRNAYSSIFTRSQEKDNFTYTRYENNEHLNILIRLEKGKKDKLVFKINRINAYNVRDTSTTFSTDIKNMPEGKVLFDKLNEKFSIVHDIIKIFPIEGFNVRNNNVLDTIVNACNLNNIERMKKICEKHKSQPEELAKQIVLGLNFCKDITQITNEENDAIKLSNDQDLKEFFKIEPEGYFNKMVSKIKTKRFW